MSRIIAAFTQFFDDSGDPLVDGWLKFTVSGTNSTDKNTYADVSETIANSNPVQLDAAGRCPSIFGSGSYRVTSYTYDPVGGGPGTQIQQFDPVGSLLGTGALEDWNNESVYSFGQMVTGSDGLYYRSLSNDNQGNNPVSSSTKWEQIEFIQYWNANKIYDQYEKVRLSDGTEFISLVGTNSNNVPNTKSAKWQALTIRTWDITHEYAQYELVKDSTGALYRSLVATNLGNDPTTDDGTKWGSIDRPRVIPQTGGGTLVAHVINELQDSNTYTLPAANSVPANCIVTCSVPDKYSAYTPTVQRAGTDLLDVKSGTDTSLLFDAGTSVSVQFVSNGTDKWRV